MATLTRSSCRSAARRCSATTSRGTTTAPRSTCRGSGRRSRSTRLVSDAVGEEITPETPVETLRARRRAARRRRRPGLGARQGGRGAVRGAGAADPAGADLRHRLPARHLAADPGPPLEPGLAEKWDLYIGGIERATAYSELVDPVVQRERFTAQAALAAAGDPEAMALDEDFLGRWSTECRRPAVWAWGWTG